MNIFFLVLLVLGGFMSGCASTRKNEASTEAAAAATLRPQPTAAQMKDARFEIQLCTDNICGEKSVSAFYKGDKPVVSRGVETGTVSAEIDTETLQQLWQRLNALPAQPYAQETVAPCKASFNISIQAQGRLWATPVCRTRSEVSTNLSYIVRDIDYIIMKRQIQGESDKDNTSKTP